MLPSPTGFRLFENPRANRTTPYHEDGRSKILSLDALAVARREITTWPGYAPTPLRRLSKLAAAIGIGDIIYTDEAERFGMGSFKALGGAYAVFRLLQEEIVRQTGASITSSDLIFGRYADLRSRVTVAAATDGNHGRSVAWGARNFGCRCVIYLPNSTSEGRCNAIAAYGAEVRRVPGTYDDAVRRAAVDAAAPVGHRPVCEPLIEVPREKSNQRRMDPGVSVEAVHRREPVAMAHRRRRRRCRQHVGPPGCLVARRPQPAHRQALVASAIVRLAQRRERGSGVRRQIGPEP